MEHDGKIMQVAEILIGKHGRRAPQVARQRVRDCLDGRDYGTALVWVQAADAATELLGSLAEGGVTSH